MKSLVMSRMVSGLRSPAGDALGAVCASRRITRGLPERDRCKVCKKGRRYLRIPHHHPPSMPVFLPPSSWAQEDP